ncbi:hypothetical protein RhiirA1_436499 [Rhizophagus irregularis]|uniref:Uncharacterized protein n=2 Tax=Rhizophagus irregularis TaxID=588596 RepID=A0A2N0SHN0_9GLOM|nr:hypothetical protein GLOIN_2v1470998 [Rhizophagus irregularis DAOM 181602=DAOM 197198]PKC75070.1 hypothetical protein RhiirA1_436499 [Rhizophagus irregularis]POG81033.1 hypothetical protein GLOIN_2v1470998 [Rhizophagus irregularis DAOM 181602=DAOM 197198]|eukprot:XP_025187899.1 hypothetical protein GLOIN_2v1470998 [Rhizophagus irregularis DAOM 181602=DAOM 197198]
MAYNDKREIQSPNLILVLFIVIEVKWFNTRNELDLNITHEDAVNSKALKCKKYITLIGATFTNFTIELIDNDEIIMQNLKEFHNSQEESPSILNTGTITITAAAAVVVGYLICRTFSRRDD